MPGAKTADSDTPDKSTDLVVEQSQILKVCETVLDQSLPVVASVFCQVRILDRG